MKQPLPKYELALPIALLRTREATMRKFKPHVDSLNLTIQQWRVIRALAENSSLTATQLAEQCVILPASITRILRSLVKKGFIVDAPHPDRRSRAVALSPSGKVVFQKVEAKSSVIYKVIEDRFSREKMSTLLGLLIELQDVADNIPVDLLPAVDDSNEDTI